MKYWHVCLLLKMSSEGVFSNKHSWGFLVWPLHKGMEGFPSPFGSLKAILWDWSYFSVGLISLYAIPKNCAVIHFFGIAWSDFQSSRFVTWPICYSLLIKKKFLRGESNPSPLDKTCMLYQLSYWGMVKRSALKLIYGTKQPIFFNFFLIFLHTARQGKCARPMFWPVFF